VRDAALTLRDCSGLDSLMINFLADSIVVNVQCYTEWSEEQMSSDGTGEEEQSRGRQVGCELI